MRELNIDFLDLYKSVDRFIRDAYSSNEGVSSYIRIMEADRCKGTRYVKTWADDYDMLKHIRWIRNQLAHEVGYDSDICTESDYSWLLSFKEQLYAGDDPLSLMDKSEKAEDQRRNAMQKQSRPVPQAQPQQSKAKTTLWEKIKRFFSGS